MNRSSKEGRKVVKMDRLRGGKNIDEYIAKQKPQYQPVLRALRKLVNTAAPELEERIVWGNPAFVKGKEHVIFLYVIGDHVNLGFLRGVGLGDPTGLLKGTGKGMRHIKVWGVDDIKPKEFAELVKQAVGLKAK